MRQAYAEVTRWVRFNATMALRELEHCNEAWIAPHVNLFLAHARPEPGVPDRLLALLEEAASVVWLLYAEHEALLERLRELFGPTEELLLPHEIAAAFETASAPVASLRLVRRSVAARASLLEAHAPDVDAHTRLVFKKHITVARTLLLPSLDALVEEAARLPLDAASARQADENVVGEDALARLYEPFVPTSPRPHPDDFLSVALLRRSAPGAHVGSGS
jgi:hypothetical protein